MRIQKVLAQAGIDSRRHCEELVEEGRVTVNGTVITSLPAWVDPEQDKIAVDGQMIRKQRLRAPSESASGSSRSAGKTRSQVRARHVYIMLNKPRNVVTTNSDPSGRTKAVDLVQYPGQVRLFCVGRLDADSTGLLMLTNDGDLANKLTHPKYGIHKTYEVVVKGSLDEAGVAELQRGIFLHDRRTGGASRTQSVRLSLIKRDRERTRLKMELREGRNRQIRRMMARLGYPVKRLIRIQLGPLRLTGLSIGNWRPLTTPEIRSLKRAAAASEKTGKPPAKRG
ncbi:MAG: rRNA pseudouridine synthase [Planctomycetes bacterium]|nr:rRNA pseudouridine synthase [Planctomycetota bacterium]NOG54078.1 rRNA pseudouridine synthase [Planctomycetota bacterium]